MKALIIDDEPMPAKDLATMIKKHCFEISSTEICLSPSDALSILEKQSFDLIFLDIKMPEMTGFEFIKHSNLSKHTKLIITTAYEEYAIQAFNVDATHYLVKPVEEADLIKAVRKVFRELKTLPFHMNQTKVISIYDENEHHIIQEEEIIRIEADGNYTTFFLADKKIVSSKNIGFYSDHFSKYPFFKPHRSHIINLKKVSKLKKGKAGLIFLSDGSHVPLSRQKHDELEKALGI